MIPRYLYFLVEGWHDKRFVEQVVRTRIPADFEDAIVYEYAQNEPTHVRKLVLWLQSKANEYLFLCDLNRSPCVSDRKRRIRERFSCINEERIVVVARSIEAWYVAGLDEAAAQRLRLGLPACTDDFDKQKFDRMIEEAGFDSRTDFIEEILKGYDWQGAIERNRSLKYLARKLRSLGHEAGR